MKLTMESRWHTCNPPKARWSGCSFCRANQLQISDQTVGFWSGLVSNFPPFINIIRIPKWVPMDSPVAHCTPSSPLHVRHLYICIYVRYYSLILNHELTNVSQKIHIIVIIITDMLVMRSTYHLLFRFLSYAPPQVLDLSSLLTCMEDRASYCCSPLNLV